VPEVALAPAVVPPPPGGKRAIRKSLKVAAIPVNPPLQSAETISPQAETKRLAWISGNKIELAEPIKFLLNEAVILPESLPVVNDVLKVMQENPGIKIRVEGHTDDEGPARYNQELSEYRSIWIKIFLLARGIAAERVQVFGFGKSRPVASNTTPVGREKNRRVELRIIGR
jgi:outer membrane protein OmpA-like peptidoglycan-associated protein